MQEVELRKLHMIPFIINLSTCMSSVCCLHCVIMNMCSGWYLFTFNTSSKEIIGHGWKKEYWWVVSFNFIQDWS